MSQKENIIRTYRQEDIARDFDPERYEYAFQRYKHKIEAGFLKKTILKLDKGKKLRVLDVACGTGRMLRTIKDSSDSVDYYGLDTSKAMTRLLKEKADEIGLKVNLKQGDATKIPFKDNFFDIVFTYHLTWHLPQNLQKKIILEMLRVTKKGGYVVFDILNENFLWEKIKKNLGRRPTDGIYKMKASDVRKIIGTKGASIEKLSDFPERNPFLYFFLNSINLIRKILPSPFFHMIYFRVKK